jgi:hypothetical protein
MKDPDVTIFSYNSQSKMTVHSIYCFFYPQQPDILLIFDRGRLFYRSPFFIFRH